MREIGSAETTDKGAETGFHPPRLRIPPAKGNLQQRKGSWFQPQCLSQGPAFLPNFDKHQSSETGGATESKEDAATEHRCGVENGRARLKLA